MNWPTPVPGLVIRYSYLWQREAVAGQEEGVKDRPCAIVLVVHNDNEDEPLVAVLPITHTAPAGADGLEIPSSLKNHLGLDEARSWVMVSEGNLFRWPGPDLRPLATGELTSIVYGSVPPRFFKVMREKFLANLRADRTGMVRRT